MEGGAGQLPTGSTFHCKIMSKNKIIQLLSSVRLAIILMAVIVLLCVIATVIPQNLEANHYAGRFGVAGKAIITFLGFDHVFSSPLFFAVGMAFAINLFICTYGRIEQAVKRTKETGMILGIWGSPILHVGLCVILAGVAFSLVAKHEIYYEIPVGETVTVAGRDGGFTLTLDDFSVDYYDGLSPKQYRSSVTIRKPNLEPTPLGIQVNSPAKYNGVSIMQQSFGWEILVTLSTGRASTQLRIKDEDWITVGENPRGATTLGIAFYPDYNEEAGISRMESHRADNPRIVWVLQEGDNPVAMDMLAVGETSLIQEPLSITFDGYRHYSGLQMKYDPGIPVIFCGFLLVCLGLVLLYVLGVKKTGSPASRVDGDDTVWQGYNTSAKRKQQNN